MPNLKSIEDNFSDFNRLLPLQVAVASNIGAIAAWMDFSAVYCGLSCSDQATPDMDRLGPLVCRAVKVIVSSNETLKAALNLTLYPFLYARNVAWGIGYVNGRQDRGDNSQSQMQGINKGQAMDLAENTQRVLERRAEVALRHGGNYKLYIEQMMEPMAGFGELAEQNLQRMRTGENLRMMARTRAVYNVRGR